MIGRRGIISGDAKVAARSGGAYIIVGTESSALRSCSARSNTSFNTCSQRGMLCTANKRGAVENAMNNRTEAERASAFVFNFMRTATILPMHFGRQSGPDGLSDSASCGYRSEERRGG